MCVEEFGPGLACPASAAGLPAFDGLLRVSTGSRSSRGRRAIQVEVRPIALIQLKTAPAFSAGPPDLRYGVTIGWVAQVPTGSIAAAASRSGERIGVQPRPALPLHPPPSSAGGPRRLGQQLGAVRHPG